MKKAITGFLALALIIGFGTCSSDIVDTTDNVLPAIITADSVTINGYKFLDYDMLDGYYGFHTLFFEERSGQFDVYFNEPVCRVDNGRLTMNLGIPRLDSIKPLSDCGLPPSFNYGPSNAKLLSIFFSSDALLNYSSFFI